VTISTETRKAGPYSCNGSQTVFSFAFRVFASSEVVVTLADANGVETVLVLNTHYTVSLNADQDANPGGSVTTIGASSPYASGNTITLTSDVADTQGVDLPSGGPWSATVVERALDRLTVLVQQVRLLVTGALRQPVSDAVAIGALPTKTARLGKFLAFDGTNGDPIAADSVTGVPVTAFMQTVLDDTTAAAARTTLGLNDGMSTGSIIDAKGDIIVGTADNTPARKAVGTNGQIIVAASGQSDGLIWTDYSREPLNVNPNFSVDMGWSGSAATVAASVGGLNQIGLDGWSGYGINPSGAGAGTFTMQQVADPDYASRKALKISCTVADVTVSAGDRYFVYTAIEGYDAADLNIGTASASSLTVMFQFKSSKPGTYGVSIRNSAVNRSYIGTITVADTAVHDYSVTLTLDTSGTWLYTNGQGLLFTLCLMSGSTFQSTAGSWQAGDFVTTSAQVNFMDSNTNVAYLGRVHVIPGGVALSYAKQNYDAILAKCQRYYERGGAWDTTTADQEFRAPYTGGVSWPVRFAVTKRAAPSVTVYAQFSGSAGQWRDQSGGADLACTVPTVSVSGFISQASTNDASQYGFTWVANARLS